MVAPNRDEHNGRITAAVLRRDIQALTEAFRDSIAEAREHRKMTEERLRAVEKDQVKFCEQAQNNHDDIVELRSHSNRWDVLVTLASAMGATIAGLLGRQ